MEKEASKFDINSEKDVKINVDLVIIGGEFPYYGF